MMSRDKYIALVLYVIFISISIALFDASGADEARNGLLVYIILVEPSQT